MLYDSYLFLGELLASSTMGVTLFDLFGEIVSQTDLKYFLRHRFNDFLNLSNDFQFGRFNKTLSHQE